MVERSRNQLGMSLKASFFYSIDPSVGRMAADDSMDDDVFEDIDSLRVSGKKGNTPSPTGYRDYKPPAEVLKLCQSDVIEDKEQIVHKVRLGNVVMWFFYRDGERFFRGNREFDPNICWLAFVFSLS